MEAAPPLAFAAHSFFSNPPAQKIRMERSGKARRRADTELVEVWAGFRESERTLQVQATTHAERAKWVRAKATMSPQIETSSSERAAPRSGAARMDGAGGKESRRVATNSDGAGAAKCGDLSLVSN